MKAPIATNDRGLGVFSLCTTAPLRETFIHLQEQQEVQHAPHRTMIVQELHRLQHAEGALTPEGMRRLAQRLGVPAHRLQEVASFFPHFRLTAPPRAQIDICRDMSCHLRGSERIFESLVSASKARGVSEQDLEICQVSCLGRCDRAPFLRSTRFQGHEDTRNHAFGTEDSALALMDRLLGNEEVSHTPDSSFEDDSKTWDIDPYPEVPGYLAVRKLVAQYQASRSDQESVPRESVDRWVIESLETAGLLGMGGAGGRAYKKWNDVRLARGETKYVVCNGDESEPGTFKDRELLLHRPHLVLEGMILAGLLLGASRGICYIRHEYEEQIENVRDEIRRVEGLGLCGPGILGTDLSFVLEVFVSPGGYICGEQTALIEAIENKRAEPRNRPPELQTNGLWDCPTLLNNVETFAWVPAILLKDDGHWYASQGRESSKGKRLFSISGDLERPGVYEVPAGITLRELIYEKAQGMKNGVELKAFAPSGPSGGFLPRRLPIEALSSRFVEGELDPDATHFDLLDWKLDVPTSRRMGLMLGGGLVVYGEGVDMVSQAVSCLRFFRNESCGKCVPCRIGSQKLVEMAESLHAGVYPREAFYAPNAPQRETISELSETMIDTAICGLGTVASNPMQSLLQFFEDDVTPYLRTTHRE